MKPQNENHADMMAILEVIGSKWNLMFIRNLESGSLCFTELQKRMDEINSKTLTCHLRYLEKYNIIDRKVFKCDLCDGDPQCVRFCDIKAVEYKEPDRVSISKKRAAAEKIYAAQKQAVALEAEIR